jgi:hypothetical protein
LKNTHISEPDNLTAELDSKVRSQVARSVIPSGRILGAAPVIIMVELSYYQLITAENFTYKFYADPCAMSFWTFGRFLVCDLGFNYLNIWCFYLYFSLDFEY